MRIACTQNGVQDYVYIQPRKPYSLVRGWIEEIHVVWRDEVGSFVLLALRVVVRSYRRITASSCSSCSIEVRTISANQMVSMERRRARRNHVFVTASLTEDDRSECKRRATEEHALPISVQYRQDYSTVVLLAGSHDCVVVPKICVRSGRARRRRVQPLAGPVTVYTLLKPR